VGGIDIVTELVEGDLFDDVLPAECKAGTPEQQVAKILAENEVVVVIDQGEDSKTLMTKLNELKI